MLQVREIARAIYLPLSVLTSYYQQIVSTWYSMLFQDRLAFLQQLRRGNDLKLVESQKNIMLPRRLKQLVLVSFRIFLVVLFVVTMTSVQALLKLKLVSNNSIRTYSFTFLQLMFLHRQFLLTNLQISLYLIASSTKLMLPMSLNVS